MPFDLDESNPTDSFLIPSFPANERAHRTAVKGVIDVEHDSAEGRHVFGSGNSAAQSGITTWVAGSLYFRSDIFTGEIVLQRYNGSTWDDIAPPANVPRLDAQGAFTVSQFAETVEVTPASGTPDTLAIDTSLSPSKYATIVGDTIISNPTGEVAGHTTTIQLELIMDGTGGYTITFGSEYRTPSGSAPLVATGASERTLLFITLQQDGNWAVTTLANMAAIT